jgi:D-aminoacyl-tRNA deacylase
MRLLIQRVQEATVKVDQMDVASIKQGLLVFVGIEYSDDQIDLNYLAEKLLNLRIFNDDKGKMNHSVTDVNGEILVISQFTLFAATKKGNRPSYMRSMLPDLAEQMYLQFVEKLKASHTQNVNKGIFGADMKVSLINDGPVTIWLDSKNKE